LDCAEVASSSSACEITPPCLRTAQQGRRRSFIATDSIAGLFIKYGTGWTTAAMSSISSSHASELTNGRPDILLAYIGRLSRPTLRNSHHASDSRTARSFRLGTQDTISQ